MAYSSNYFEIEVNANVGTLWLNRPEKLNAISHAMWLELPKALDELASQTDVRAIVIAGRGPSFCVGIDLAAFTSNSPDLSTAAGCIEQQKMTKLYQDSISSVADCSLPVICAIQAHCLGAGVDLATACDIRLATKDAIFGVRETKIGIVADVGTLQRLPAIVGAGHVAELAYTGKDIGAARAEKIGLVNDVFDSVEALYEAANEMASEIAANAPLAVQGTKMILQQGENLTTEQSLLLNGWVTMASTLNSNDLKEAMTAFMQKRPSKFTGT